MNGLHGGHAVRHGWTGRIDLQIVHNDCATVVATWGNYRIWQPPCQLESVAIGQHGTVLQAGAFLASDS